MSVISLSKKLSLLVALSITAATVSLPVKAWIVKNNSSRHMWVKGPITRSFAVFDPHLSPGQIAACDAAESECGAGGWIYLCVFDTKTHHGTGYVVAVYGGMGVTIYDDKVKTVRNAKYIDNPDVNLFRIHRLDSTAQDPCPYTIDQTLK